MCVCVCVHVVLVLKCCIVTVGPLNGQRQYYNINKALRRLAQEGGG